MIKSVKIVLLALAASALSACYLPSGANESERLSSSITRATTEICLRGNKYLYLSAGNTSQVVNIWDKSGKVIPCEEGQK